MDCSAAILISMVIEGSHTHRSQSDRAILQQTQSTEANDSGPLANGWAEEAWPREADAAEMAALIGGRSIALTPAVALCRRWLVSSVPAAREVSLDSEVRKTRAPHDQANFGIGTLADREDQRAASGGRARLERELRLVAVALVDDEEVGLVGVKLGSRGVALERRHNVLTQVVP